MKQGQDYDEINETQENEGKSDLFDQQVKMVETESELTEETEKTE